MKIGSIEQVRVKDRGRGRGRETTERVVCVCADVCVCDVQDLGTGIDKDGNNVSPPKLLSTMGTLLSDPAIG